MCAACIYNIHVCAGVIRDCGAFWVRLVSPFLVGNLVGWSEEFAFFKRIVVYFW